MAAAEFPQTTPATELVAHARPPLGALSGRAVSEVIAAADRAVTDPQAPLEVQILGRFLLHHRAATAAAYSRDVLEFARWCSAARGISILGADRAAVELWIHTLEVEGMRAPTLRRRLAALQGYYLEAADSGAVDRVPTLRVKRPTVAAPAKPGLSREDASLLLEAAEDAGPRDEVLVRLLLLNGLRASEAAGLRIGDVARERGHRTLTVQRKGGATSVEAVSRETSHALDRLLEERGGSAQDWLFVTNDLPPQRRVAGTQLSRHGVARVTRRLGRAIGCAEPLNPHELRHAFITLGLDAGATLRDLQRAAAHADPRTTAAYDRRRKALDSHPAYLLERYLS